MPPKKIKKPSPQKKAKSVKGSLRKLLKVGAQVPDVVIEGTGGRKVRLTEMIGKNIVLYFYPRDSTPGCTVEGKEFTDLHEQFKAANAEVFGVSRDSIKSHEKFKSIQGYTIDLLSDPKETLCQSFGVIKQKNMYGKSVRGIERSTFVINPEGCIIREWRAVKVPGHAAEVLAFVKSKA